MKKLLCITMLGGLFGCAAVPIVPHSAPELTQQQIEQMRAIQTRTLPVGVDAAFPRAIDVLLDNGYLVRSVDKASGFIAFYQQWTDSTQGNADLVVEGSLVLKPVSAGSTQMRLALTGSWQAIQVSLVGRSSTTEAMIGGVQQSADVSEYQRLLDMLQRGLTAAP